MLPPKRTNTQTTAHKLQQIRSRKLKGTNEQTTQIELNNSMVSSVPDCHQATMDRKSSKNRPRISDHVVSRDEGW